MQTALITLQNPDGQKCDKYGEKHGGKDDAKGSDTERCSNPETCWSAHLNSSCVGKTFIPCFVLSLVVSDMEKKKSNIRWNNMW